jgi:hypothetical protein
MVWSLVADVSMVMVGARGLDEALLASVFAIAVNWRPFQAAVEG